ncbi:MAG: TIGR04086 family membrane protein [Lachnospiraceae bacterium]|nr:TIGR04086 family membrane protein [Lachnospiraceae bacterium]
MKGNGVVSFLVVLGGMYLLSALLLAIGAGILWKVGAGSHMISGAVIAVYVIVNFIGGFILGKWRGKQKLLWGCLIGVIYFAVLVLAGVCFMGTQLTGNSWIFSGIFVCGVTGMLGGMLAPANTVKKGN